MVIPKPFSKAIYVYGEPIVVPRDGDLEEWRSLVESRLNALTDEAESRFDELWEGTR